MTKRLKFSSALALLIATLFVTGGNAAQAAPLSSTSKTAEIGAADQNQKVQPLGWWWPEVKAYVGCGAYFSYSAAAWDLQGGAWYRTVWHISYSGGSGGGWADDINGQTRQASSQGFLTTSTFYGGTSNYTWFQATVVLYKDGMEVGRNTASCGK